jgi:hypothetical protein
VVATGYGATGLPAGHQDAMVLAKPYDPAELISVLDRICGLERIGGSGPNG